MRSVCSLLSASLVLAAPALAQTSDLTPADAPFFLGSPMEQEWDSFPGIYVGNLLYSQLENFQKGAKKPVVHESLRGMTVKLNKSVLPKEYQSLIGKTFHGLSNDGEGICKAKVTGFELLKPYTNYEERQNLAIFGKKVPKWDDTEYHPINPATYFWSQKGEDVELYLTVSGNCSFALGEGANLFAKEVPPSARKGVDASEELTRRLFAVVREHSIYDILQEDYQRSLQQLQAEVNQAKERHKAGKATEDDMVVLDLIESNELPSEMEVIDGNKDEYQVTHVRQNHPKHWTEAGKLEAYVWYLEAPAGYATLAVGSDHYCAAPQMTWVFRLDAQGNPHLLHVAPSQHFDEKLVLMDLDQDGRAELVTGAYGNSQVWKVEGQNSISLMGGQVPSRLHCDFSSVPPLKN